MYAMSVRFVLEPGSRWEAEQMANLIVRLARTEEGFIDMTCLSQHETGDYLWTVLFKSQESSMYAFNAWYEPFMRLLGDYGVLNTPYAQLWEVQTVKKI